MKPTTTDHLSTGVRSCSLSSSLAGFSTAALAFAVVLFGAADQATTDGRLDNSSPMAPRLSILQC